MITNLLYFKILDLLAHFFLNFAFVPLSPTMGLSGTRGVLKKRAPRGPFEDVLSGQKDSPEHLLTAPEKF